MNDEEEMALRAVLRAKTTVIDDLGAEVERLRDELRDAETCQGCGCCVPRYCTACAAVFGR